MLSSTDPLETGDREDSTMDEHAFQVLRLSGLDGAGIIEPLRHESQAGRASITLVGEGRDSFGEHSDAIVKWPEERVYKDVIHDGLVGPMKVVYERTVSIRVYAGRRVLLAAGLRRQYQKLLQVTWRDRSRRPSYREERLTLHRALSNDSFSLHFRESLRDVVVVELQVGRIRNALLRAPSTDVESVLELVGGKEKRLRRATLQPRSDQIDSLTVTDTGGLSIRGRSDNPFAALSAAMPGIVGVGLLEASDG